VAAKKVTDRDRGYRALVARLKALGDKTLTVGVHEAEGAKAHEGDTTVLEIATWMEFGTTKVPARSFLAGWADERQKENEADFKRMALAVVNGRVPSLKIGLERLGLKFVKDIGNRIRAHIPPPLAQSTIDRKGSSTPLIDTGHLISSILHKVEDA
jgi:hypothetical protein